MNMTMKTMLGKQTSGAFEAAELALDPGSMPLSQTHYNNGAQIRLVPVPVPGPTSHQVDYPPKPHEKFRAVPPYAPAPMVPIATVTSYNAEFPRKVGEAPRVPDRGYLQLNPPEMIPAGSTTHAQFPGHAIAYPKLYVAPDVEPPAAAPAPVYQAPAMAAPPAAFAYPPAPLVVSSTPTPTSHYNMTLVPHPLKPARPYVQWPPHVAAPPPPEVITVARPPISAPVGWQLPLPRKALGLQIVHSDKGVVVKNEVFHKMLPAASPTGGVECTGSGVFTTVADNQQSMCVLIIYGDSDVATENQLLGQFDIVGIPPQAMEVPRLQVTFTVDNRGFLKVWARELDSNKHKVWIAAGGKIVAS